MMRVKSLLLAFVLAVLVALTPSALAFNDSCIVFITQQEREYTIC
jgi:hypothetical protein